MGERILQEEGYEVVTITDGQTAMARLADVDPDLILADVDLPRKSGYELCEFVKTHPRYRHIPVLLTAGMLDPYEPDRAREVQSDGLLRKPFEASVVLETVKPLLEAAAVNRAKLPPPEPEPAHKATLPVPPLTQEVLRAAVAIALDEALPSLVEEITQRVLIALGQDARQ